ncbi:3-oxoacyl-ACP synthase III family protein [Shewanella sp. FJAT-52076]|uniref:3-oxoacyl-ACP synthase III family protein n=1 Tax=Shewanella sp. FJAT-52076 TaxID=2864202 RepID=UPI001C65E927|nr:ketoacyl-ACP synthase III [Shewanella sp. FJAT-52076]QYJ74121.1 ketoacyl-ACP synthase III [Shewanella sp. FJAT-52076]
MAQTQVTGVEVRGMVSVVPTDTVDNYSLTHLFNPDELKRVIESTGIEHRRVAGAGQTVLSMATQGGTYLLNELGWDASPGLVICVTQTPDFMLPGNAVQLQHRLGLGKDTLAFDVNLGCSGFVYGLWQAATLLSSLPCRRALLVVGDTTSQMCGQGEQSRAVSPLFGDAISVIALEKNPDAAPMHFSLGSDGAGAPYLIQPNNAALHPGEPPALSMDGTQVFVFTLREVPTSINAVLDAASWDVNSPDAIVLHQANEMMLRRLADKLGFTTEQMIIAMKNRGNTSSASIPLAITDALHDRLARGPLKMLLSGFGVGWSWGSAAVTIGPLAVCKTMDFNSAATLNS